MNYANMIEEKNLKKTFIIATLCSTLIGTFTSSIGLWDRINDKRKQRKLDSKQTSDIKELRDLVEKNEKRSKEREAQMAQPQFMPGQYGLSNGMMQAPGMSMMDMRGGGMVDPAYNFRMSGDMIQRQYDEGYQRLGSRFAVGDTLTENALQAQIISLQQTVISILQDALYADRPLSRSDLAKLIAASNAAREGSLEALRRQQQRLAIESSYPPRSRSPKLLPYPDDYPDNASRISGEGSRMGASRGNARPLMTRRRSSSVPSRTGPINLPLLGNSDMLFCRYATDLQYIPAKPLAASFAPGGSCTCPTCGFRIPVSADDFWCIGKAVPLSISSYSPNEQLILEQREYVISQRFIIKSHTIDGSYACAICHKHGDLDAVCRTPDALVKHVGRFHDVRELEMDVDVRENVGTSRREAPLSVVSSGSATPLKSALKKPREVEVREVVYR